MSDASPSDSVAQDESDAASMDETSMDASDAPAKPPCTADAQKTGVVTRVWASKTYYSYAPPSYMPKSNVPLVVALHGAGDKALNYLNVMWTANADAKNFVVIAPEGSAPLGPGYTWNTGDRATILKEIDDVSNCYDLDPKKTIIHGFSAGGIMAYWIGLKDAKRFSGIAINSADLGSAEAINGAPLLPAPWTIPVSHFHGDQDMNFPLMYAQAGITRLMNAGHMTYFHVFSGGHTASPPMAAQEFADLASSSAP